MGTRDKGYGGCSKEALDRTEKLILMNFQNLKDVMVYLNI
jgi:hypothetical protein